MFNSLKLTEREESIAGDWDAVYHVDLENLKLERFLTRETVAWPSAYGKGWVADLHAVSEDGATAFLKVGVQEPDGFAMDYFMAKMDMDTKRIQLVAPLRSAFF